MHCLRSVKSRKCFGVFYGRVSELRCSTSRTMPYGVPNKRTIKLLCHKGDCEEYHLRGYYPCSPVEVHRRSGGTTASIFRFEEQAKEATSKKEAGLLWYAGKTYVLRFQIIARTILSN
jgi:hypothetical protein